MDWQILYSFVIYSIMDSFYFGKNTLIWHVTDDDLTNVHVIEELQ